MKQQVLILISIIGLIQSQNAMANGERVARYTVVLPHADSVETDPFKSIVKLVFPKSVVNVEDAVHYLVRRTGYRLAKLNVSDPMLPVLLKQTIPEVHREIGPISVEEALRTIAGEPWELISDPVNRLISYELKPNYRTMFEKTLTKQDLVEISPANVSQTASQSLATELGIETVNVPEATVMNQNIILTAEQHKANQKKILNQSVAVNLRNENLTTVIGQLMPVTWAIDIKVSDEKLRSASFDFTSQATRARALNDFLTPLGLKIDFYPGLLPKPLAIVSGPK